MFIISYHICQKLSVAAHISDNVQFSFTQKELLFKKYLSKLRYLQTPLAACCKPNSFAGVPAELVDLLSLSSCCCPCRCWRPCSCGCRCCCYTFRLSLQLLVSGQQLESLLLLMSILLMASVLLLSPAVAGAHAAAGVHAVSDIYAGAEDYHCCWRPECCRPPFCCWRLSCSCINAVSSAHDVDKVSFGVGTTALVCMVPIVPR